MSKKIIVLFLLLTMLVVPLVAACDNAPSAEGEKTELLLAAGRVGDPWYVMSEAIAYYVNNDSDFLRVTASATAGMGAARQLLVDDPHGYIGMLGGGVPLQMPLQEEFKYYGGLKWIASIVPITWAWVTYDPEIKTIQDFAGKNIGVPRNLSSWGDVDETIRRAGVLDQVTVHRMGIGGAATALRDGQLDATYTLVDHVWPGTFGKGRFITEMETKDPIYYVNIPRETLIEMGGEPEAGQLLPVFAELSARVYPGGFDTKTQSEALGVSSNPAFLGADEKMDEDIVYEITRIVYEHADDFAQWHVMGQNMSKTFLPTYAYFDNPEDVMHPGALKYYKDNGIEVKNIADLLPK